MKKMLLPLVAVFFLSLSAGAQETRPLIQFGPFQTQGISVEESRFIETLLKNYLSVAGELINDLALPQPAFPSGGVSPDSWIQVPDYYISGTIYLERDNRVFTLEIFNIRTEKVSRSTTVHKTASDLALKARSLVESVFNIPDQALKGQNPSVSSELAAESPEIITEKDIIGTWRGDSGIEMIRLQQNGRGIAFFSSGVQMNLSYTIENNTLTVKQNSPNMERFYYPIPLEAARQLSASADPMRWELLLYSGGTRLRGVRVSTEARIEDNTVVELFPETEKDSLWVRTGH